MLLLVSHHKISTLMKIQVLTMVGMALLASLPFNLKAQTIDQTLFIDLWQQQTGTPDTVEWSVTVYGNGAMYVIGNTNNGLTSDILVTKFKEGELQWTQTHDVAGFSDYGTGAAFVNDKLYVCGTSFTSLSSLFDYVVLVYDEEGTLQWSETFDGDSSDNDIPSSIAVDNYEGVYVTGASGNGNDFDYWTVKVDSGSLVWEAYYDYGGYNDFAASLFVDGGGVNVVGVNATDSVNWDFYLRVYDFEGVYGGDRRMSSAGIFRDELTAAVRDAATAN